MAQFVTVAVFTLPHEYAVVRARMESEGILCFAKDESTVSAHPFYSNLVGGIKLQVPSEDVERAREMLLEAGVISEYPQEPVTGEGLRVDVAKLFRMASFPASTIRSAVLIIVVLVVFLFMLLR